MIKLIKRFFFGTPESGLVNYNPIQLDMENKYLRKKIDLLETELKSAELKIRVLSLRN